ncbi:hypothetical protein GOZ78_24160 [Agrobacterium vitis]|uniref:DUF2313 domain-containing protein n=1 Tax=Agrobacterium vitis TaxID=373 RepID=A0ABD6GF12_AGRVI|nr:hypothetical protein [Agrobacterium vitis]MUO81932.1 hypothetical protein [Agrobacterium vitis]MUO94348.1 hypothetical protein [Agrobacterium vitis]MUP07900.1 hypothetical protein [Agrobacterium vitis]MUZ85438.1 hypothetical protein [Agrobacterium vitis]MVA13096.1 hypothetical protein [Agrobacterium vitis]
MVYPVVIPPFDILQTKMDNYKLSEFKEWFLRSISIRIKVLEDACKADILEWRADFEPESLITLASWAAEKIEIKRIDERKIDEIKKNMKFPGNFNEYELTYESRSLAFDIGLYLAETLRRRSNILQWTQIKKKNEHPEHGLVVLSGFVKNVKLNSTAVGEVLALRMQRNKSDVLLIKKAFDYWVNLIP